MDKQIWFVVFLSVLLIYNGVVKFNPILQIAGIALVLFLIYDVFFYRESYNIPKSKYKNKFNIVIILGNMDLVFGALIVLYALHDIIPHVCLSVVAILVLMKASFFVFHKDIASMIDVIISLLIILDSPILNEVKIIVAIYFIQKGALTYFS